MQMPAKASGTAHVLEHEDNDMMRPLRVEPSDTGVVKRGGAGSDSSTCLYPALPSEQHTATLSPCCYGARRGPTLLSRAGLHRLSSAGGWASTNPARARAAGTSGFCMNQRQTLPVRAGVGDTPLFHPSPVRPRSRERPSREAAERPVNKASGIRWRTPRLSPAAQ